MRILVTGGAGFIGSNFVHFALGQREVTSITVLDNLSYAGRLSNLTNVLSSVDFVQGDIRDGALVDKLVSRSDFIVHFAAESHNDNSLVDPKSFLDSNVFGTFELLQAAVRHNVRFHHISTDEVFGDMGLDNLEEFTLKSPYNPSSPYSASKAASDHLVRAWSRSFGLRATISNCGNNYGPGQHEEKFIPRTILLAASGIKPKIYGTGQNVRDWIHVEDHCRAVWDVMLKGTVGNTYLIGAGVQKSNLQVLKQILKALELPAEFFEFVEDRPGHDRRYAIDPSSSRFGLGWRPLKNDFEQSLNEVVEHYLLLLKEGQIDITQISKTYHSISAR